MSVGITTSVTSKGQVTIPVHIRKALGISKRDRVEFTLEGKNVSLRPIKGVVAARFGVVRARRKPEDFQKLKETFTRGVAEEVLKETR